MAADLGNVNVAPAFCSNFNIPNNESCTRCCSLERKVDKLQGELLSVLEIIKVLQEDGNILQHQGEVPICRPNCSTAKEESSLETLGWTIATVVVNRYEVLQSQQEKESVVQRKNENGGKCKQRSLPSTKKRTVTVIGDSHTRGCAENIKYLSKVPINVTGYVKPNASTKDTVESAKSDITKLTKNDFVVVWGGTNDISKNNAAHTIRNLTSFANKCSHTNVLLISAPHRHDLIASSCVNKEVKSFNCRLKKRMGILKNVRIIDVNLDRNKFTRYGLHLNNSGKQQMGEHIMNEILNVIGSATRNPIVMDWTRPDTEDSTKEADVIEGTADRGDSAEEGDANKRTTDRGDSTEEDDANKGTTDRGDSAEEGDANKRTTDRGDSTEEDDANKGTTDRGDSAEEDDIIEGTADRGDSAEEGDANKGTTDRGDSAEEDDVIKKNADRGELPEELDADEGTADRRELSKESEADKGTADLCKSQRKRIPPKKLSEDFL
ncbi:hypothetical protein ANN_04733 [Periplaneta americana]|uniref:SGNH hydrolase-type esterase domain-containing protein n=1 Tax=Periplaneta americana TaxID=6978 RepID=A0ABQ8T973_PERAM|nr:hypothetical protein ANN_04733 [Periplaneta americana]